MDVTQAKIKLKLKTIDREPIESPELKKKYADFWIEYDGAAVVTTQKGNFVVPLISKRANAWICSLCKETPYINAMEDKFEFMDEEEYYKREAAGEEVNSVPLTLFISQGSQNYPVSEIDFCFKCVREHGLLDAMVTAAPSQDSEV